MKSTENFSLTKREFYNIEERLLIIIFLYISAKNRIMIKINKEQEWFNFNLLDELLIINI